MVQIASDCYSLQKAGYRKEEYEDAFQSGVSMNMYRFAVADGASESSFANVWAGLLAGAYCNGKMDSDQFHNSISKLSKAWKRKLNAKNLPWYAQEKLSIGAFSTLAGITFRSAYDSFVEFDAMAIGDSCIFQIRDTQLVCSFPLASAEDFHNRPILISSNGANNLHLQSSMKKWSGTAQAGDSFWLMTDALACWMLTRYEEGTEVIKQIQGLTCEEDFFRMVETERKQARLKNDDVTLIRVNLW